MPEEKKRFKFFKTIWAVISTVSSAIGLVSIVDNWYAWHDVFENIIANYRSIVYWPIDLFQLNIPSWVKDYFLITFITFTPQLKNYFPNPEEILKEVKNFLFWVGIVLTFILWPVIFLFLCYMQVSYFFVKEKSIPDKKEYKKGVIFFNQILFVLLIFFALVLTNNLMT